MKIYEQPDLQKYIQTCPTSTVILNEGDRANSIYILISGKLDVIKGGKKIYEINKPGAFFGELSFLLGTLPIASVISAAENTSFLKIPKEETKDLWTRFPELSQNLATILAERLHETTNVAQGFREFCDRMPDAVIMTDKKCKVLSWNRAAEKLYGRPWHQMYGKSIEEIYDNQANFKHFMDKLKSHEDGLREKTLKINHPDKEWFFVSTSTTVIRDPGENIQGYLFLGRDVTSLQQLEQSHRRFRNWLLPVILGLALLTGWLSWQNFTNIPQPTYLDPDNPSCDHLIARIRQDSAALQLALRPALAGYSRNKAKQVMKDYFKDFRPESAGIKGAMVLDHRKKIGASYFPASPGADGLNGKIYQGSKFSKDIFNLRSNMNIYLVSRNEAVGGPGVEVTIPLTIQKGWLAFQLEMDLVDQKYSCDINDLAQTINR